MSITVPFSFVDVFAREPLAGNPLSLVPDADVLSLSQMTSIAREFNQSETTFLLRPTAPTATWRLRSFTPAGVEVFGAGHNAMGAWIWLADKDRLPANETSFVQQIGTDLLPVQVTRVSGTPSVVSMDQSKPVFGSVLSERSELAAALGIAPDDLSDDVPTQVVSTGAGHLLVPVRSRSVVDSAAVDAQRLLPVLQGVGGEGCYVFSLDPVDPAGGSVAYARFFNPTVGIIEDPATGTAAGPLVVLLAQSGRVEQNTPAVVEQGFALGRPSRLEVTLSSNRIRLSGSGVIVAEGVLHL